jgi:hypothetical protein
VNILLVGNSILGSLLEVYDPSTHLSELNISFLVIPGGDGPDLDVNSGILSYDLKGINSRSVPYIYPDDNFNLSISNYDVIVIFSLGFIGDPNYPSTYIMNQALISSFNSRVDPLKCPNILDDQPITTLVAENIFNNRIENQPGIRFVRKLREQFSNRIIFHQYPKLSSAVANNSKWVLNTLYENPYQVLSFYSYLRDEYLKKLAQSYSLLLLDDPFSSNSEIIYTPAEYICSDCFHPNEKYSKMIWNNLYLNLTL